MWIDWKRVVIAFKLKNEFLRTKVKFEKQRTTLQVTCDLTGQQAVGLSDQVTKCMWWMPWRLQAMKDVAVCDNPRGVDNEH